MTKRSRIATLAVVAVLVGTSLILGLCGNLKTVKALGNKSLLRAGLEVSAQDLILQSDVEDQASEALITNKTNEEQGNYLYDLHLKWEKQQITFNWWSQKSWQIYAAYFVYRNYEEGVTESEADLAALKLGEEDSSDWAVKLIAKEQTTPFAPFVQLSYHPMAALSSNLTNELYYAVKFANPSDLSEYVWVRGKVNYRPCAHSPLYDMWTTRCDMEMENGYYVPTLKALGGGVLSLPDGYEIIDWDTEWQEVLQSRWAQAQETLNNSERYLKDFAVNMDNVEQILEGLEKTAGEASGTEEIAQGLTGQKQKLEELRAYYATLFADNGVSEELGKLRIEYQKVMQENQELKAQLDSLTEGDAEEALAQSQAENAALKDSIRRLEQVNAEVTDKNHALEDENAALNKQITSLASEYDQCMTEKHDQTNSLEANGALQSSEVTANTSGNTGGDRLVSVNATDVVSSTQDESDASKEAAVLDSAYIIQNTQNEDTEALSDVDVPKLGEETTVNIWLGVVLIAVAFGALALWLKRVFLR